MAVSSLRTIEEEWEARTKKGKLISMCSLCASSGIPLCLSLLRASHQQHTVTRTEAVPSHRSKWIQFSVSPAIAEPAPLIPAPSHWYPLLRSLAYSPVGPLFQAQRWPYQLSSTLSSEKCGIARAWLAPGQDKDGWMTKYQTLSVNSKDLHTFAECASRLNGS